jgi:hypothetical protein
MRLSARQLNRATLERQLLLRRQPLAVVDAVRRLLALQAQEPASPYLALWNRLAGFDPADLDAAFAGRAVVKASLLRLTLHAVAAEDYRDLHVAMLPSLRASRLNDERFTSTGLSTADVDAVLPDLLDHTARPRTADEIQTLLEARLGAGTPRAWWALRTFAPLHHAPTGGPWSFDAAKAFVAAPPATNPTDRDAAVQRLVLRYLQAFGPASVADVGQFTMLRRPEVKRALAALDGEVEELAGPDGTAMFDLADGARPTEDEPAPPRLLPMWDNTLLAYADRSRIVPPEYRPHVIRRNGDVLPTLLVDGYVAGVWRPVDHGIEATAFHRLDDDAWAGLGAETAALRDLLDGRDPRTYGRYGHWWDKGLPGAEVRVLARRREG